MTASPDPRADQRWMLRALELAARGEGNVEPNPMVGCVIAARDQLLAEGWHSRFGAPHAEIEALADLARRKLAARTVAPRSNDAADLSEATLYVTLEPCCHHGQTPPCTEAILDAGVRRVVVACRDPFPQVAGEGIRRLLEAGVAVEVGTLEDRARRLLAPYLKLQATGRPWVIGKWAMTLDGHLATVTGDSRWISGERSRAVVHQLRGRVDGVMVGAETARRDDPQLTARPPGPRQATRIVVDRLASLKLDSQLVQTATADPVLLATGPEAPGDTVARLRDAGVDVVQLPQADRNERLQALLDELGRRRMTNLLVEGGGQLLGSLFDLDQIDEFHVFIAPQLSGGQTAPTPLAGTGRQTMAEALRLVDNQVELLDGDIYVRGRKPDR